MISGSGFPFDIILPSQVEDRIRRIDGSINSLSKYVVETSSSEKGKVFLDCFDSDGFIAWVERWIAYKRDLSWLDININTVGVWDQLDTYEREYATWRKTVSDCGGKVPSDIEKPPSSQTSTLFSSAGLALLGLAAVILVTRK